MIITPGEQRLSVYEEDTSFTLALKKNSISMLFIKLSQDTGGLC